MRTLLICWIIGCWIVGLALGVNWRDCPKDEVVMPDAVMAVAVWPVFIVAVWVAKLTPSAEKAVCKRAP